jgi:putative PIN family toxin of toxin-antitoxin system
MVAELTEKLRQKFGFPQNDIHAVVYSIRQTATCVEIAGSLHVVHADPEDDKFVECAVVSGAQTIVSGDRHLLTLGSYNDIQILAAADCVRRYGSHE